MTIGKIHPVTLSIAGAFILAAAPLHSASLDSRLVEPVSATLASLSTTAAVHSLAAVDVPDHFEAALDPGEFVWEPTRATGGEVEIVVSLPLQRLYVYRAGTLIGVSTVSTGKRCHETPAGIFNILQKRREHYSNRYNNAPMPFMQRLTWGGIALHAGQLPGHPASHGCVRLPLVFARHLFGVTRMGATVHIVEDAPAAGEALVMARAQGTYQGMGGPLEE